MTGPGRRPCSKRQANSTTLPLVYKDKLSRKYTTSYKTQHVLKLLQKFRCLWNVDITFYTARTKQLIKHKFIRQSITELGKTQYM